MRLLISNIIADQYKAYDLPLLGERFGLAAGTTAEAMNSKRQYIGRRLEALNEQQVMAVARELATEVENEELDRLLSGGSPADEGISTALGRFDKHVVHKRWTSALERRNTDPEGAITLARTLLEDVLKWLLTSRNCHTTRRLICRRFTVRLPRA